MYAIETTNIFLFKGRDLNNFHIVQIVNNLNNKYLLIETSFGQSTSIIGHNTKKEMTMIRVTNDNYMAMATSKYGASMAGGFQSIFSLKCMHSPLNSKLKYKILFVSLLKTGNSFFLLFFIISKSYSVLSHYNMTTFPTPKPHPCKSRTT